jgi:hypothetical protein
MTFSRPGDGEILATGLTVHFSLLTSGGGQTFLSPFNVTCTLAPGQSDAVASFRILPAPAPALSPTHGTATSPPVPRPTPSPTQSAVTSSAAPPPSPAPTPRTKLSALASYLLWAVLSALASYLLWPVGIVVAGGLGGAAWWLLRRWLAQRPAR